MDDGSQIGPFLLSNLVLVVPHPRSSPPKQKDSSPRKRPLNKKGLDTSSRHQPLSCEDVSRSSELPSVNSRDNTTERGMSSNDNGSDVDVAEQEGSPIDNNSSPSKRCRGSSQELHDRLANNMGLDTSSPLFREDVNMAEQDK